MTKSNAALLAVLGLGWGLTGESTLAQRPPTGATAPAVAAQKPTPPSLAALKPAPAHATPRQGSGQAGMSLTDQTAVVKQYCVTCHNDRTKAGTLSLASFDAAKVVDHA